MSTRLDLCARTFKFSHQFLETMQKYTTIIITFLSITILTATTTTDNYRVFAQGDKAQDCKSKQADMFSKLKQWLSKRQTAAGQLDQDGSLRANLISLSKEMTQITQDCRGIIDLSQPPTGYTKEDVDKLKRSVFTELCKIENCST
jgi:N-acetylglutamate synthase/N-acetylornithine aminotransferase